MDKYLATSNYTFFDSEEEYFGSSHSVHVSLVSDFSTSMVARSAHIEVRIGTIKNTIYYNPEPT
jgi:hypothetical protein